MEWTRLALREELVDAVDIDHIRTKFLFPLPFSRRKRQVFFRETRYSRLLAGILQSCWHQPAWIVSASFCFLHFEVKKGQAMAYVGKILYRLSF